MTAPLDRALSAVGRGLWHLRLAPAVRWLGRHRTKVLLYHACEPSESDWIAGLDVNCPPTTFAAQLDHLGRHYRVVPLEALEAGTEPPGAVAITFDDGYRSVLDHAVPLLAERDMPAVVYLVTDVVDNREVVWVNELNWLLRRHPAAARPRAAAALGLPEGTPSEEIMAAAVGDFDSGVVDALLADIWSAVGGRDEVLDGLDLYLTWDDVRAMGGRGIAFGSHTASHPDLRRVDPDRQADEIERSIAVVERELGSCTSFAFPFGFADDALIDDVERRPLRSVMLVGSTHPTRPPRRRTRSSLSSADDAQIFAELEVVAPAKELVRALRRRLPRR